MDNRIPLAERMRPKSLDEVVGQDDIIGDGKILTEIVRKKEPVNIIFWGPPGTGKTTLARIIANEFKADFVEISAVTAGKKDVEKLSSRHAATGISSSAPCYSWTKFTVSTRRSKMPFCHTSNLA